jgi:mycothione reductase
MTHFDLAVIGSGSGNSLMTPELADRSVALVERGTFGGTCLNVGCIPTKMFVYPADVASAAADARRLGLSAAVLRADWPAIRDRVFGRLDAISAGGRDYRATGTANVTLFEAEAVFSGERTLSLSTGETITADQVVIATGSRAVVPDVVRGVPFHTSDTVMRLEALPERMIVLGGGYIAAELAHVFSSYGVHTTVLARSGLLRSQDDELSMRFQDLVAERWNLRTGVHVTAAEESSGEVRLTLSDGSVVAGDVLLVATGRVPNSELHLGAAGVRQHLDGRVVVDAFQRTSAEGVWALGDVSSDYQLKHVANHEARVVAHNLAHPDDLRASDHRFVPSAVFTHPQLASVGMTERQVQEADIPYVVKVQDYGSTAYGWAMVDDTSVCKLIADPATGQLLGAHLMGEQAASLIQPLIQAMSFGLSAQDMARGQYWIHPALTEVVENALLGLDLDPDEPLAPDRDLTGA